MLYKVESLPNNWSIGSRELIISSVVKDISMILLKSQQIINMYIALFLYQGIWKGVAIYAYVTFVDVVPLAGTAGEVAIHEGYIWW